MQPCPFGEKGVCKRNEKSTAGAAPDSIRGEPRETVYFS
jgi:hypothetical protein